MRSSLVWVSCSLGTLLGVACGKKEDVKVFSRLPADSEVVKDKEPVAIATVGNKAVVETDKSAVEVADKSAVEETGKPLVELKQETRAEKIGNGFVSENGEVMLPLADMKVSLPDSIKNAGVLSLVKSGMVSVPLSSGSWLLTPSKGDARKVENLFVAQSRFTFLGVAPDTYWLIDGRQILKNSKTQAYTHDSLQLPESLLSDGQTAKVRSFNATAMLLQTESQAVVVCAKSGPLVAEAVAVTSLEEKLGEPALFMGLTPSQPTLWAAGRTRALLLPVPCLGAEGDPKVFPYALSLPLAPAVSDSDPRAFLFELAAGTGTGQLDWTKSVARAQGFVLSNGMVLSTEVGSVSAGVSFASIAPIIQASCQPCHHADSARYWKPAIADASWSAQSGRLVYEKLLQKAMPPRGSSEQIALSDANRSLLLGYASKSLVGQTSEATDQPAGGGPIVDSVWDNKVKPIFSEACSRCHSSFLIRAQVTGKAAQIKSRINSGQMPPMGSNERGLLTPEKKASLIDWIDKL